jgi:hypothetical protein
MMRRDYAVLTGHIAPQDVLQGAGGPESCRVSWRQAGFVAPYWAQMGATEVKSPHKPGSFTPMDSRSHGGAPKILCVEPDEAVRETRCAVLKYSGYDAASASPRVAESVLRS